MVAVCVMFMVPHIAGRISGTTVWNWSVTVADTTWSAAQGDVAQETLPDQLPEPSIASILALPAVLTESGAATTPARTPSRAAAVARLRVSHARLSSTIEKRTKSSTGSTTTNSRVDVPRLLKSFLIVFMVSSSGDSRRGRGSGASQTGDSYTDRVEGDVQLVLKRARIDRDTDRHDEPPHDDPLQRLDSPLIA